MRQKPKVEVKLLEMEDPTFEGGSVKVATAVLTNTTTVPWTYAVELYLGITKAATSGVGTVTIPAGASSSVNFTVTMPTAEASYPVYIDVLVVGELIAHYLATEPSVIEVSPAVDIGDIVWG